MPNSRVAEMFEHLINAEQEVADAKAHERAVKQELLMFLAQYDPQYLTINRKMLARRLDPRRK